MDERWLEKESELNILLLDLNSLSSTKINNIGKLCIKYIKYYKHIVHNIEKWSKKSISQQQYILFIIDSIIKHGSKLPDDIYAERFGINLFNTLENINELKYDMKLLAYRIIQSWIDKKLFSEKVLNSISSITNSLRIDVEKHGDKEKVKEKERSKLDTKSSKPPSLPQHTQPILQQPPYHQPSPHQPSPHQPSPSTYVNPYDPYYQSYPNDYDKYNRDYSYDYSNDPSRYHDHDPPYRYDREYRDERYIDRSNHYDYHRSSDSRRHGSPDRHNYDPRNQDYSAPPPPSSFDRSYRERDHERDINRYSEPSTAPIIHKQPSNNVLPPTAALNLSTAPIIHKQPSNNVLPPTAALNLPDLSALLNMPTTNFSSFPPPVPLTNDQNNLGKTESIAPSSAFEFDYGDEDDEYLNRKPRPAPTFSSSPPISKPDDFVNNPVDINMNNKPPTEYSLTIHPDRANVHPDRMYQDRNPNSSSSPPLPAGYSQGGFQNQYQNFPKGNLPKLDGMIMMQDQSYSPPGFVLIASTTLWLSNLPMDFKENEIRAHFSQYGQILNLKCMPDTSAFATFEFREIADYVKTLYATTPLNGQKIKIGWGKGPAVPKQNYMFHSGLALILESFLAGYQPLRTSDMPLTTSLMEIRQFLNINHPDFPTDKLPAIEGNSFNPNMIQSSGGGGGGKPCNFGSNCNKPTCRFVHPPGWDPSVSMSKPKQFNQFQNQNQLPNQNLFQNFNNNNTQIYPNSEAFNFVNSNINGLSQDQYAQEAPTEAPKKRNSRFESNGNNGSSTINNNNYDDYFRQ